MYADKIDAGCTIGGHRVKYLGTAVQSGIRMLVFTLSNGKRVSARPDGWVSGAARGRNDLPAGPVRRPTRVELKCSVGERQTSRGEGLGLASSRRV